MTTELDSGAPTIELLLAHEGWLRRLVAELVDEQEADDILQETWAAALRFGPLRVRSARAWLRRVAENLARQHRRASARRRSRELAVPPQDEVPATADMVAKLQAHQRVAQAVSDLPEPYRTAVLLRFFEELPPREIARRLALEGSTVRTRIERGLQMLRSRLEGRDVRALATLILAPRLAESTAGAGVRSAFAHLLHGGIPMATTHKAASAAVLVVCLALCAWGVTAACTTDPVTPQPGGEVAAAAPQPPIDITGTAQRTEVAPRPDEAAVAPPVRGRIVDPRGQPLGGVPIDLVTTPGVLTSATGLPRDPGPTEQVATSDAAGRFTFALAGDGGGLRAGGGFATVRTWLPPATRRSDAEALLVAAPRTGCRGIVVDRFGMPIPGVAVVAKLDGLVAIDIPVDHASAIELPVAVTDARGGFAFADLPLLPELALEFQAKGYRIERRYELGPDAELRVRLEGDEGKAWRVRGTVVDEAGRLVQGATVFFHLQVAETGRFGEFAVESKFLTPESQLLAGIPGRQIAARPDLVGKLLEAPFSEVSDVVLPLGGPALDVAGQVLDGDGKPIAGLVVTLLDARVVSMFHTVEDFVAGVESKLEQVGKSPAKVDARTDAAGRFRIGGLAPRGYRLRVFEPATLASATVPVAAGMRDLIVRLPRDERRAIAGVVHGRSGAPIAGVQVVWGLATVAGKQFRVFSPGGSTATDAQGRFALSGIPPGDLELSLSSPAIVDLRHPLEGVPDGAELRIPASALCRFRVEIEDATADHVAVLDESGARLELRLSEGQISRSGDSWALARQRTPVLEVSEAAREIVVLQDEKEIARHPITLDPSRVEVLRR